MPAAQTRRKRRVGQYLRQLRERAGRTTEEAARLLHVKQPTITRMENGQSLCRRTELTALVAYYGGSDAERAEAEGLWEDAKQDTARVVLPGGTMPQLRSFLSAEAEASLEKIIVTQTVHGLLQTYDYATAITQAPTGFRPRDEDIERIVDARIRRQGRLRGPNPLNVHAIMDESTIHRIIGSPAIMREQFRRLMTLSEQDNVTVQLVPYTAGAYSTMSGNATILEFPDSEDPAAAYVEYVGGGKWVEDPGDVEKLAVTFDFAARAALSPTDTVALFRRRIEELLEHDQGPVV